MNALDKIIHLNALKKSSNVEDVDGKMLKIFKNLKSVDKFGILEKYEKKNLKCGISLV